MNKLPFAPGSPQSWHWRWEQFYGRSAVLHRVAKVDLLDEDRVGVVGTTVCGRRGKLHMPGVISRLRAPRCKQCCQILRVPPGDGAPYNRLGRQKDA